MDSHRVTVIYKQLNSNLLNLPSNLTNLLFNANVRIQDVIIEVVLKSTMKYYAGWSGMSSSKIKTIEIDSVFAQSLNLPEHTEVIVNLKLNNYETHSISLEPVTSSDWELVELHAQTLEDKLLSQTRCVSLNQILVVYPSLTSSAKLLVTNLGSENHTYAKISPACEVSIAPKVRVRKAKGSKSSKSMKSNRSGEEHIPDMNVIKRSICLPHSLYAKCGGERYQYEVYINLSEFPPAFKVSYISVTLIPGPNFKLNSAPPNLESTASSHNADSKDNDQKKVKMDQLKENTRIIAKVVNYLKSPKNTVGLSPALATALSVIGEIGNLVILQPAPRPLSKPPSTLIIHPYSTNSRKADNIHINAQASKEENARVSQLFNEHFIRNLQDSAVTALTNFLRIPALPGSFPNGALLRFKRKDDHKAWIEISSSSKFRIELGEEIIRSASFVREEPSFSPVNEIVIGQDSIVNESIEEITNSRNTGVLVHGSPGSGKTLVLSNIASRLASDFGYHVSFIACEDIMNENYSLLTNNHIKKWIQECSWYQPSVLIIDNLEKILSQEVEHVDSALSNQVAEYLILQLQKIHEQKNSDISLLCSAASRESLNNLVSQSHLIEKFIHLKAPDKAARLEFLTTYIGHTLKCKVSFDIMDIVSETEGYLPNDLKTLCDRIYHEALFSSDNDPEKGSLSLNKENLEKGIKGFVPSNIRGVLLQKSVTNWSDIGGLQEAKRILLETLEWPTKYAPVFANCPLRLRSGILLYGYPGCGKTLLASAVAGQCGLNFISIKGPEILNKYIGASEQSVRELFERAQSAKPCILFFDEFDSIAPKRGHDSTGVTDRVVNQMLTQMDGAEGLDGVYVLAATSRPDLIDSALLRPGRLDKSVFCSLPNYEDRLDILKSITNKMDLDDSVVLEEIAERASGFSGADLQGLGYNAYLKAVHLKLMNDEKQLLSNIDNKFEGIIEFFKLNTGKRDTKLKPAESLKISQQIEALLKEEQDSEKKGSNNFNTPTVKILHVHFLDSLNETKPSISHSERIKLDNVYDQFVSGRDGNMPDGSNSNEIGGRTTLM